MIRLNKVFHVKQAPSPDTFVALSSVAAVTPCT